jgi:hypothetical protein
MSNERANNDFEINFTSREVTAWGGLALVKRMLDQMGLREALNGWDLPQPGSNRGYAPTQLIEQWLVSIWCGACRFAHTETTRMDSTLVRLFGWPRAAGHRAIVRLFERFDQARNDAVQAQAYRWFFDKVSALTRITLDVDSTVLTRHGLQEGATRGYNPGKRGRPSYHPLLAFVAETRMVANFWLRPGNANTANNAQAFLEATLHNLGAKTVGLFRADSGFYSEEILGCLEGRKIDYIVSAKLTQALQGAMQREAVWWALETGLELSEISYQAQGWAQPRRLVLVRQSVKRKNAPGKTLSLFADDPDLSGWRYGAMVTSLSLPALEIWRSYRGRADCENRIKELKADFGLDSFALNDFWATEAALGFAMLAYNLMSLFRQAVMRTKVQHTLSTLHGQVLAIGASWHREAERNTLILSVPRRRRGWFEGLWSHAGDPPTVPPHTVERAANG